MRVMVLAVAEDAGTVSIPFELETALTEVLTVTFSTTDGTAEEGADFVALGTNNTETIAIGAYIWNF